MMRDFGESFEISERNVRVAGTDNEYLSLDLAHIAAGKNVYVTTDVRGEERTQEGQRLYELQKTTTERGALAGWNITRMTYDGDPLRQRNCDLYLPETATRPDGSGVEFLSPSVVMKQGSCIEYVRPPIRGDKNYLVVPLGRIARIQLGRSLPIAPEDQPLAAFLQLPMSAHESVTELRHAA